MKKKRNSSKIAMGTISIVSVMTPSACDSDSFNERLGNPQNINEDIHTAISIKHTFSKEEIDYIHFIQDLIEQTINNPAVASQFANSPEEYIKNSGYKVGELFNKNIKHLKLITALGDLEVREKLETRDLQEFLVLCKEKGYAENYSGNLLEWIAKIESDENQRNNILYTRSNTAIDRAEFVIPIILYATVVAAEFYYFLHVYKTKAWTDGLTVNRALNAAGTYIDIALLTEDEKTAYMICDQYIEHEVNIIVNAIKEENPYLTENQLLELTNFLKKNLVLIIDIITQTKK